MKTKPFAITLDPGSSLANRTGSWRTVRPEYVDRLPPCNHACPAGENIQGWLFHAESGHYEEAWRMLTQDNPLPAVMGRVCYHPCETACNRAQLDECVGINAIERFLGDEALRCGWKFAKPQVATGKRVLDRRGRALGPVGRLSARAPRPRSDHPRSTHGGRRHDALRNSQVPPAARGARRGDPAHSRPRTLRSSSVRR